MASLAVQRDHKVSAISQMGKNVFEFIWKDWNEVVLIKLNFELMK